MTLTTPGRNAACDGFVDTLNTGTIVFETVGNSEVATCTFPNPAFGAAVVGVATAGTIVDDTSATGGVVDHAHLKTSAAADQASCTCTVTGGGGDFELTSLTIGAGDTVSVTSLTVTQPAGP